MKYIYNRIFLLALVSLTIFSCEVDDYQENIGPRPLDAPAGMADDPVVSYETGGVVATDTGGDEWIYLESGGTAVFNIEIIRAPGTIDSVSYTLSNSVQPAPLGTVSGVTFSQGETTGMVSLTYTAGPVPGDEDITITVWDAQDPRKSQTYSSYGTFRISECHASSYMVGFYNTLSSGVNGLDGSNYTDLAVSGFEVYMRGDNNPGYVRFADGSFGLYGLQGYGGDFINVEICGNEVLGASESGGVASDFTYSGTVNADGSLNITWSTIYGDSGTTVMTPCEGDCT